MDWKTWESHKAGIAKLSIEEAEQYATELLLSRSIALPTRDEKKEFLYTPAQLQTISRSRRIMQTLGTIVKSRHLDYYYQAVYLLQFLHNLYPNAIPVQDYGKLLVYLKVEAVMFVACCSMSTDRVQVAQCLITQLFDDCDCESCDVANKQQLENMHEKGRVKLNQILATNDKLRLTNLLVGHLSSQEHHKAMCEILEGFFKGIDDALPPPTIIQVIQDFQKSTLIENSTSEDVTPSVIPTQTPIKGKSLSSKQSAPDSLKTKGNPPKSSGHDEMIKPTEKSSTSSDATIQDGISKSVNLPSNITSGSPKATSRIASGSAKVTSGSPKITSGSPADSPQPQEVNSPMLTEDTNDSSDDTTDNCKSGDLKFISTHSRIKRTPVPPERLIPLVTNMKCKRNLIRSNGKCDRGTTQPKIKSVRIVLSPLPKEDYMRHLKLTPNKPGRASTLPVQQKEPPHKESVSSSPGSALRSSSDEDPASDINKTCMVLRTHRKAPQTKYTSYLEDRRKRLEEQLYNNQEQLHTSESDNSGIVTRIKRKRKSVPPVRYAPFAVKRHWGDAQRHNRERSDTPDSESVISESVTSSVGSDTPLVNLCT